ncbi:hypothetical protein H1C71_029020, partial [Ictidomys tridecemlineatus]
HTHTHTHTHTHACILTPCCSPLSPAHQLGFAIPGSCSYNSLLAFASKHPLVHLRKNPNLDPISSLAATSLERTQLSYSHHFNFHPLTNPEQTIFSLISPQKVFSMINQIVLNSSMLFTNPLLRPFNVTTQVFDHLCIKLKSQGETNDFSNISDSCKHSQGLK